MAGLKFDVVRILEDIYDTIVAGITATLAGDLPDTAADDLAHIHANSDNLNVGDQVKADSLSISPATDIPLTRQLGKVAISQAAGDNHVEVYDSAGNGITSTGNALDINIKSGNPATTPDTPASDFAHIHDALGAPTDAVASITVDEDATARSHTSLLKAIKNMIIDISAYLSTLAGGVSGTHYQVDVLDSISAATVITETNVVLAVVDTEYHYDLPANTKAIEFVSRGGFPVRYAFTTGKVAGLVDPYFILKSNNAYEKSGLNLSSKIIYFASDNAGDVVELIAWS